MAASPPQLFKPKAASSSAPAAVCCTAKLARLTFLGMYRVQNIGTHYARTLAAWRRRFHDAVAEIQALRFYLRTARVRCRSATSERETVQRGGAQ